MNEIKFICRTFGNREDCPVQPKVTEKSEYLTKMASQYYYSDSPNAIYRFVFFEMGTEMVWKFSDCGFEYVVFPMDRLPFRLEEYLREIEKHD